MGNDTASIPPSPANRERKLAALLSADVVGYSRLMSADEAATLDTLAAYRRVIDALIQQHRGRVVNTAGDSVLAEFASAVDAVQCAVEIQCSLTTRNADLQPERKMEFRIGINVGDVMIEGEQLYGDGVNVAARLQALADAGGVFISGTVYDQIESKLPLTYAYLGEQTVKNIPKPVRTYRVVLYEVPSPTRGEGQGEGAAREADQNRSRFNVQERRAGNARLRWAVVGLILIAATIVAFWRFSALNLIPQDSAPRTDAAPAALPLPDKPSVVILPFVNLSNDPDQEYFSDGLTEDLTSALSRLSGLFVISRNSAFTYKGKPVKAPDISKELGVQYVLEGSVRKAEGQLRVTAQLIDALQARHLWTERYDWPLKDSFALQDEIVQKIVTTLKLQLSVWEQGWIVHKHTDNLEAYDTYLRGMESLLHAVYEAKREANEQARQMFERAVSLDLMYAEAHMQLGRTYFLEWLYKWNKDPIQTLERAFALAQKAVALGDSLPGPHELLVVVYVWKKQYDQAVVEAQRVIALAPSAAEGYWRLGQALYAAGQPQEAISLIEKAMRLNPHYPAFYLLDLGTAYAVVGRCEEALAPLKKALTLNPNFMAVRLSLAVCYVELGRLEETRLEVTEVLRINSNWSLESVRGLPYKDSAVVERMIAALRKAGLK